MNTIPKRRPTNRLIAILLVLSMTFVYVVGDNCAPLVAEQSDLTTDNILSQTLSYTTDLTGQKELTDISDLVLAENTTAMGKTSESLSESFAQMPVTVKNQAELDDAVATFNEQINALKATANEELSETDNGTDEFKEYKEAVLSSFNDLEVLLSDISVENYETVMSEHLMYMESVSFYLMFQQHKLIKMLLMSMGTFFLLLRIL